MRRSKIARITEVIRNYGDKVFCHYDKKTNMFVYGRIDTRRHELFLNKKNSVGVHIGRMKRELDLDQLLG